MGTKLPLAILLTVPVLAGQSFEVASVKPAAPSATQSAMSEDGAQFSYTNVALIALVMRAYHVKYRQIVGPERLAAEHYDVVAKLPDNAAREQIPQMLQRLLTERFGLAVHSATKMVPGYALVVGKSGPRMKTAASGDGARRMKSPKGLEIKGKTTMAKLADVLADSLDCPVVDMTELAGSFEVDLNWTPDENAAQAAGINGPSISSAVQEELGLRLEPRKYPYELLVIDHAEKIPTRN